MGEESTSTTNGGQMVYCFCFCFAYHFVFPLPLQRFFSSQIFMKMCSSRFCVCVLCVGAADANNTCPVRHSVVGGMQWQRAVCNIISSPTHSNKAPRTERAEQKHLLGDAPLFCFCFSIKMTKHTRLRIILQTVFWWFFFHLHFHFHFPFSWLLYPILSYFPSNFDKMCRVPS